MITNLLFVFNHINYGSLLVKYHSNLLQVNETHLEIGAELKQGLFSLKRTSKGFFRLPIDLSLEQTITQMLHAKGKVYIWTDKFDFR